ncbi:hypothetical protein [Streptomyces rimosus]|uniref:hypothetical protein n=1 Tax=Streptomyces rimosus TaxID=1927 RepID=UPI00067E5829|nr:hypothetical protein [Streptomyces rimosus]
MPHLTTRKHGRRPVSPVRTALLLAALGSTAALTTACSAGPAGVELGDDWEGSKTFALAEVDGLVTVVGINPDRPGAQSLAAVPQQADDDDAVSPHIAQLADGRWVVTVPRKDDKPDRRYVVNRKDHTLDGMAGDERLRRILPGKTLVGEVAGLPDTKAADGAPASSVLVRDPADWSTKRELKVPGTIGFAASDPSSDTVCLGSGSDTRPRISVANLSDGKVTPVAVPDGLDVKALACRAGHPVIAGSDPSGKSGRVKVSVTAGADATTVSVNGGRVDAVRATGSSIVVAAAKGKDTELVEVDATSGKELHRARVKDLAASLNITPTSAGWLVYTENTVTRVNLTTGETKQFDLPGTLQGS